MLYNNHCELRYHTHTLQSYKKYLNQGVLDVKMSITIFKILEINNRLMHQ